MPRIGAELPRRYVCFLLGSQSHQAWSCLPHQRGCKQNHRGVPKDGHALVFDKDHLMLNPFASAEDRETQGHYKLSLREDGLWLTDIRWVPDAEKKIRDGKLIYFSPYILKTERTNIITKLVNTALTNLPVMKGIRPFSHRRFLIQETAWTRH